MVAAKATSRVPKLPNTANLVTGKLLFNATISDSTSRFMTTDITDFYLGTPLTPPEYMVVRADQMPLASQLKYISHYSHIKNDSAMGEVTKSIYSWTTVSTTTNRPFGQTWLRDGNTHTFLLVQASYTAHIIHSHC